MKLGNTYDLVFFHSNDLTKIARRLLEAEKVTEYNTSTGKLYVGLSGEEAVGSLVVEEDRKRNTYLAKALYPDGSVRAFVIFTEDGARISINELSPKVT